MNLSPDKALSDAALTHLWAMQRVEMSSVQRDTLPNLRAWLMRRTNNPLACFLVGKLHREPIAAVHGLTLSSELLANFQPKEIAENTLNLLLKLVDHGNTLGLFSLCPPPIPVLIKKQSSPFAADRWPALAIAPRLRSAVTQACISPRQIHRNNLQPNAVAQIAVGHFLTSAIVYGGILHISSLKTLLHNIVLGTDTSDPVLKCFGNRVFIDMSLDWRGQADAECRRWFPDPLSAVLLMEGAMPAAQQWLGKCTDVISLKLKIWQAIRKFLVHAGINHGSIPSSLTTLIDAVRLDFETRIPMVLVHYAARSFVSHSLKHAVWRRIHGMTPSGDEPAMREKLIPPGRGPQGMDDTNELEPHWLYPLRAAMHGDDRRAVIMRLEALLDMAASADNPDFAHGSPGHLFTGFAHRLFSVSGGNKVLLAPSTARAYAISAAKSIGGLLGHEELRRLDADEWATIFQAVMEDAETSSMRRKMIRVLREFQQFLELVHHAEPINVSTVLGYSEGLVTVDANIISHDEFLKIRAHFEATSTNNASFKTPLNSDDALAKIAWLVLTLAYRCGLRRMEVLKLELHDILMKAPEEMLVRPSASRRLKSKSATRKLPLYALLDTEERNHLQQWLQRRIDEESKAAFSNYVFALPARNFMFVPQDLLFDLLHQVMRDHTGDASLRFHHLRHSFASRVFLTLNASTLSSTDPLEKDFPGFVDVIRRASEFRQRLYGNQLMTRRDVYAVSSLLGHSGPDVSLEHYIHVLDICLAEHLSNLDIAPNIKTITAVAGKSLSNAYLHVQHSGLHGWVAHLWRIRHLEAQTANQTAKAEVIQRSVALKKVAGGDSFTRIWRLLLIHQTCNYSIEDMVTKYGVVHDMMTRYINNSSYLADLKLAKNSKHYRHRFMTWVPDKRTAGLQKRILCPIKPHERRDRELIQRFIPRIREIYQSHKSLSQRVFDYFAHSSHPDFAGVYFTDPTTPEAARDFLAWLKLIGLEKNEICFISYDVTQKRSKFSAKWKRALDLRSAEVFLKKSPYNGNKNWACPWLGIEPVFLNEKTQYSGAAAMRFLMVMAYIASNKS